MCGIAGAINFNKGLNNQEINSVKSLSSCMCHRGPDADGFFNDDSVALAHRRLSIIGLNELSNQPMSSVDDNIVIVFNGEIYNHEEIKILLQDKHDFKTKNSDTEVIINAYKEWGIECLHKFVGMFAMAIYDKKKNKVFIVRDRLGKKPLFYTFVNETLFFSSENQAFFDSNLLKKEFDDESIYHYLSYLTTPAPKSFFKNVFKVKAGHYHEISSGDIIDNEYWNIADYINKNEECSFDEAYEKSHELLESAMKYRNVADVPISIALSGGLDSSLNLHYTKQHRSDEIASINISYEVSSKGDETKIAERFSNENNVKFIPEVLSKEDFTNWIKDYLNISKDIPAGDPNTALMFGISRIAKNNNFKVLLVGEGGDELGGYPVYSILNRLNSFLSIFPEKLVNTIQNLTKFIPHNRLTKKIIRALSIPIYASRFIFGFSEIEKRKFWKKDKKYNSYKFVEDLSNEIRSDLKDSYLRKVLNIEYKFRLAELLLPRVDYPSMAASIEARSPFMDHKLIEYTSSISWSKKMKYGPKTLLKKIAKNKLPSYIVNAPKVGFGELLNPFFDDVLPEWLYEEVIDKKNVPIKGYIEEKYIKKLYKKHKDTKMYGFQIWTIYSLNLWMQKNQN
tara:strand:+ start:1314 stop:3182 length:1869 start_codon:yes stop_codon:yes gene_type:complete